MYNEAQYMKIWEEYTMPEAVAEELCVKFRNIDEIQEFAKAVNQFDGDVDLKQGSIPISGNTFWRTFSKVFFTL